MNKIKKKARSFIFYILWKISLLDFFHEIFYRLKLWSPELPEDLKAATDGFINMNQQYWTKQKTTGDGILIEGHLSQYGINYLFRTAVAALAIQDKKKLNIEILYCDYGFKWDMAKIIYRSFGITKSIYLKNFLFSNFLFKIISIAVGTKYKTKLHSPEDILGIEFGEIKVGDLIYDEILKRNNLKTIKSIDEKVIKAITQSYFYYLQYKYLFKRKSYKYYITTHTAYSEYGILCRLALINKIFVIETTDIQTSFYNSISNTKLPTYHQGIKNLIVQFYSNDKLITDDQIAIAKKALDERMNSQVLQIDAQKAYRGKVYSKLELENNLGFIKDRKIIFILAHIFSDSPHISSNMLYNDYYVWLEKTLEICSKIENVNWVVKPHPASSIYKEEGIIEEMILGIGSKNVTLCPSDFNTKSISNCANGIVTVQGTAGLEFACLGIPVVLAGKPFYSELGFTIEPNSVQEYEHILSTIDDITPLANDQIVMALKILSIWNTQFEWSNPIITSDVLANVWGSDKERNLVDAYKILTKNLSENHPKKLKLWETVQEYIK